MRRSIRDPQEVAYSVVFALEGTPFATLVQVAGTRWSIEECFETGKGKVGLDQYEVRKWEGWYRFITLALLAHAYLAVLRAQVATTEKGGPASLSPASLSLVGAPTGPELIATYPTGSSAAPPGLGVATGPPEDRALAWSWWRQHHQATARRCHYKKRRAHNNLNLQL